MKRATERRHRKKLIASSEPSLDVFDVRILRALAANARATNVEIAAEVGLSEAPCSRRIHRLETLGVISGYGVRLNPDIVGIGVSAFITLTLDAVSAQAADRFAELVMQSPHVLACYIVSGSDYALLHVAAADIGSYSEFVLDRLRTIPGVKDLRSNFIMRVLKESGGLGGLLEIPGVDITR
ncbi:MAG TPA: Lrp/AsnC family transcriptional regulator [Steroidobacteraceae bacterium]|nr:Lrp/AsnC family transcriptional regulator [Steroidobacteraceae bacterium]